MALAAENTGRITLRVDAPILARLNAYHKEAKIPKTRIINEALQNYLDEAEEDFLDARAGEAAWAEFLAGDRKTYTIEEVRKELGL